jgi:hypothetical protein
VQAEEAQDEQQFEKHMYAIHTLTSLYSDVSKRIVCGTLPPIASISAAVIAE